MNEKNDVFVSCPDKWQETSCNNLIALFKKNGVTYSITGKNRVKNSYNINNCKVFVVILNNESNYSDTMLYDLKEAAANKNITIIPFRTDDSVQSDEIKRCIDGINIMDGTRPLIAHRLQELAEKTNVAINKSSKKTLEKGDYHITSSVIPTKTEFIGREKELIDISERMSGKVNKLFLYGAAGIGKTTLAERYMNLNSDKYEITLFIPFEGSIQETIANDEKLHIHGISHNNNPSEDERSYFMRKLEILQKIAGREVLLVVDNFDVKEDADLENFIKGEYSVLFTTREHHYHCNIPEKEILKLDSFNEKLEVFGAVYAKPIDEKNLPILADMFEVLNENTICIKVAAGVMRKTGKSPNEMLEALSKASEPELEITEKIYKTLQTLFNMSEMTEDELYLLKNLSVISPIPIERQNLIKWCDVSDRVIDALIFQGWVQQNYVEDLISLHPSIAEIMNEEAAKDPQSCEKLAYNLKTISDESAQISWFEKLKLYNLSSTVYKRLPKGCKAWRDAALAIARMLMALAFYSRSMAIFKKIWEASEDLSMDLKIYLYLHISHCEYLLGYPDKSFSTALECVNMVKDISKLSEATNIRISDIYARLCESSRKLNGKLDDSIKYGRQAVALAESLLPNNPSKENQIAWSCYHLADSLMVRGDIHESFKVLRRGIRIFECLNDKWAASFAYDLLSQLFMLRRYFKRAFMYNEKAGELLKPIYGKDHRDIGRNLEKRGNIFSSQGDKENAEDCYGKVVNIYKKCSLYSDADRVQKLLDAFTLE